MKPWPTDAIAIICGRTDDPHCSFALDSRITTCWHCGYALKISPETIQRTTLMNNIVIICPQCINGYYKESGQKLKVI